MYFFLVFCPDSIFFSLLAFCALHRMLRFLHSGDTCRNLLRKVTFLHIFLCRWCLCSKYRFCVWPTVFCNILHGRLEARCIKCKFSHLRVRRCRGHRMQKCHSRIRDFTHFAISTFRHKRKMPILALRRLVD